MTNSINIRPETRDDEAAIIDVTIAAFNNAKNSKHNEQTIISNLREARQLSISLVAEDGSTKNIIGHAAVSPVKISDGTENWYGWVQSRLHLSVKERASDLH